MSKGRYSIVWGGEEKGFPCVLLPPPCHRLSMSGPISVVPVMGAFGVVLRGVGVGMGWVAMLVDQGVIMAQPVGPPLEEEGGHPIEGTLTMGLLEQDHCLEGYRAWQGGSVVLLQLVGMGVEGHPGCGPEVHRRRLVSLAW